MPKEVEREAGLDTFEHVVVLMLENRSFDNLLGYLYDESNLPAGAQFAGIYNSGADMPVPVWAKGFDKHKSIKPAPATDYHQPFPDPGEVYQHVNTQLFDHIDAVNKGSNGG